MVTERAIGISNAAIYAKNFGGDLKTLKMEGGDREAIKVVPLPGSVIDEIFSSHSIILYDGTVADVIDLTDNAYASQVTQVIDMQPFNAYGCTLTVVIQAKVTSGDTLYIRIKDEDGNIVGAEQTETAVGYTISTFTWTELNIGTETIDVEAYVDAGQGTLYIDSITVSNTYARPVVENSGNSSPGALTVSLDTKGYSHVSYMYDTDDAGASTIAVNVSNDNSTWKLMTTITPGGAKIDFGHLTLGFRYIQLVSADATAVQTFWISAKR